MADRAIYPGAISTSAVSIANADATNLKTLVTATGAGIRISNVSATSTDTINIDLFLYLNDGTDDFLLGRITIPAGAGSNGTEPSISVLNATYFPFLSEDLCYFLKTGYSLKVKTSTTVTATKTIDIAGVIGVY